jgi:hypothetical protein
LLAVTSHVPSTLSHQYYGSSSLGLDPKQRQYYREVILHVNTGSDVQNIADTDKKHEKLKPMEKQLQTIEGLINEAYEEMEFLKKKEVEMRDLNGEHKQG